MVIILDLGDWRLEIGDSLEVGSCNRMDVRGEFSAGLGNLVGNSTANNGH